MAPKVLVLVEGDSDRQAVLACAATLDVDLDGVQIVATNGITNFAHHLAEAHDEQHDLPVLGLYDAGEEQTVRSILEAHDDSGACTIRLHRCHADLEDELIRALGIERAVALVTELGDGTTFRKMRHQPAWRAMPLPDQLHRFMGIRSGRKARYAAAFSGAMPPQAVPPPLRHLLEDMRAAVGHGE